MSIRNLDALFRPRTLALIGASPRENSVGRVTLENLLAGGFQGEIFAVNPKYKTVLGVKAYPSVEALPHAPDLAIICTPATTVPGIIEHLGRRGTRGAIVISAGFSERGTDESRALGNAVLEAARPNLVRIVGPNCLGIASTPAGLNASFARGNVGRGTIAFVAQSGAIVTTMLDWAEARNIGFSHLVSLGNMSDVDFGDMLDYLANDANTNAILLYVEAITQSRKFVSAARAASRLKPVIAIKAGRHPAGARAATSHTGALAGMDDVYDAVFRRAGIVRVQNLEELFDAVETLSVAPEIASDGLVILTNGGGPGVLATDALLDYQGELTALTPETAAELDSVLPSAWSRANPVDILGDATPERYAAALTILLNAPEAKAILVINCPTAVASSTDAARAVAETARGSKKPVLTNWLGAVRARAARDAFSAAGFPTYDTPGQAIRGFMHLVRYREGQTAIAEVPSSLPTEFEPDESRARRIIDAGLASGLEWLRADAVSELLSCYRIPAARVAFAETPEAAAEYAREFAIPVAIKISSPDIVHKADVGGVALDLGDPEGVRIAAEEMLARVTELSPGARIDGFLVQEMVRRPGAYELIAGAALDPQFGPFLLFGQGGSAVEVVADKAIGLPPLNLKLALEMIERTRIFRQLRGFRHRPPVALDALALTLVKLSQLVCDFDAIAECEINPILADENGVFAVDARLRLHRSSGTMPKGARLVIRPYPNELETDEDLPGLGGLRLRPVRPEDARLIRNFVSALSPKDLRLRFLSRMKELDSRVLLRMSQIDYDREMTFLLFGGPEGGETPLIGLIHIAADPDNRRAEFAILVRSDLHGRGIGSLLIRRTIEYARNRGIGEIYGIVLPENAGMLALCEELGFNSRSEDDGGLVHVSFPLGRHRP